MTESQSESQPQSRLEDTDDDDDFDSDDGEEEEEEAIVLTVEDKLDVTLGMLKERIELLEEALHKNTTLCLAQEKKIDSLEKENQMLEKENQAKQVKLTMLEELFCELNHYDRDGSGGGAAAADDRSHSFRCSSSSNNDPKEEPDDNDKLKKEDSSAPPTATDQEQEQRGIDTTTTPTSPRPMMSGIRQRFRSLSRSRGQSTESSDRGRRPTNSPRQQQRGRSCNRSGETKNDVDQHKQQPTKATPPPRGLFGSPPVSPQHDENTKSRSLNYSDGKIVMNNTHKGDSNKKKINDLQLKIQQQLLKNAGVTETPVTTPTPTLTTTIKTKTKNRSRSFSVGDAGGRAAATTTTTTTKTKMNKVRIKFKKAGLEGVYTGPLVDRKPHGVGTIRFTNGDTYLGELDQGKMSGRGTLYSKTKGVQRGKFANNKFLGHQILVLPPATTVVVVPPPAAAVSPTTPTCSNVNKKDIASNNKEDHDGIDSNNTEDHECIDSTGIRKEEHDDIDSKIATATTTSTIKLVDDVESFSTNLTATTNDKNNSHTSTNNIVVDFVADERNEKTATTSTIPAVEQYDDII